MVDETLRWFLLSGRESLHPENILALFERITDRKATPEKIAELEQRAGEPPSGSLEERPLTAKNQSDNPTLPEPEPSRKVLPNSRWGRPASGPLSIGFGLGGLTSRGPKKPE
jgi:hypothetical protein